MVNSIHGLAQHEEERVKEAFLVKSVVSRDGVAEFLRALAIVPVEQEIQATMCKYGEDDALELTELIDLVRRHKIAFRKQQSDRKTLEVLDTFHSLGGSTDEDGTIGTSKIEDILRQFPVSSKVTHGFDTSHSFDSICKFLYPPSEEETVSIFKKLGAKEDHTGMLVLTVTSDLRKLIPMTDSISKLEGHSIYLETFKQLLQTSGSELKLAERARRQALYNEIVRRMSTVPERQSSSSPVGSPRLDESTSVTESEQSFNILPESPQEGGRLLPSRSRKFIQYRKRSSCTSKQTTPCPPKRKPERPPQRKPLILKRRAEDLPRYQRPHPKAVYMPVMNGTWEQIYVPKSQRNICPSDIDLDSPETEQSPLMLINTRPLDTCSSIDCYTTFRNKRPAAAPLKLKSDMPRVACRVMHLLEDLTSQNIAKLQFHKKIIPQVVPCFLLLVGCVCASAVPMRTSVVGLQSVMRMYFANRLLKRKKGALEQKLQQDIKADALATLKQWSRKVAQDKAFVRELTKARERHRLNVRKKKAALNLQRVARAMVSREEAFNYYAYIEQRNRKIMNTKQKSRRGAAAIISNFIRLARSRDSLQSMQSRILKTRIIEERLDAAACLLQQFAKCCIAIKLVKSTKPLGFVG